MFEMKWFLFCTNNQGDRQRFPIGLQQPRPQLNSTKEGEIESSPVASGPSRGEGGGGGTGFGPLPCSRAGAGGLHHEARRAVRSCSVS